MHKFLITVLVPAIELEFNIYLPNNKKMGTIKENLIKIIQELSPNTFSKQSKEVLLVNRDTGKEIDCNVYVKDSGIKNGSKIMVM